MLIICCGMIRSGSTLQYNLVRNILESSAKGVGEGYIDSDALSDFPQALRVWIADDQFHVIKTHDLPSSLTDRLREGNTRIFYIYRDIREVARSAKAKWGYDLKQLLDVLDAALTVHKKIENLDFSIFTQRYELVTNDLERALADIGNFLDIKIASEELKRIKNDCSVENTLFVTEQHKRSFATKLTQSLRRIGVVSFISASLRYLRVPRRIRSNLKKVLPDYDAKTLLHANHISPGFDNLETEPALLDLYQLEIITDRYKAWLQDNNYTSMIDFEFMDR